jgi:hypothetical protein
LPIRQAPEDAQSGTTPSSAAGTNASAFQSSAAVATTPHQMDGDQADRLHAQDERLVQPALAPLSQPRVRTRRERRGKPAIRR